MQPDPRRPKSNETVMRNPLHLSSEEDCHPDISPSIFVLRNNVIRIPLPSLSLSPGFTLTNLSSALSKKEKKKKTAASRACKRNRFVILLLSLQAEALCWLVLILCPFAESSVPVAGGSAFPAPVNDHAPAISSFRQREPSSSALLQGGDGFELETVSLVERYHHLQGDWEERGSGSTNGGWSTALSGRRYIFLFKGAVTFGERGSSLNGAGNRFECENFSFLKMLSFSKQGKGGEGVGLFSE